MDPIPSSAWPWRAALLVLAFMALAAWLAGFAYHCVSKKAFEDYAAELAAKGESLDVADLRPDPAAKPEDNVAAAPVFAEYLARQRANPDSDDPVWGTLDQKAIPGFSVDHMPSETTAVRCLRSEPLTHGFDLPDELAAAKAILDYTESRSDLLKAIREALARPQADFEIAYEMDKPVFSAGLSGFIPVARLLHLEGRAALLTGRTGLAGEDVLALLRFSRHLGSQLSLLHQLVATTIQDMGISLIREGLAAEAWSDMDLLSFAGELEVAWLEASFMRALRMERAMGLAMYRKLAEGQKLWLNAHLEHRHRILFLFPDLRKGWCYDNMEFYSRTIQERMLEDGKGGRPTGMPIHPPSLVPPSASSGSGLIGRLEEYLEDYRHSLAEASFPAFGGLHSRALRAKVLHDHARIAVALALHRREHGTYPATLDAITLPGGQAPPLDPFNGQSFVYRPLDGADYLLYSVGPDGLDDGGRILHRIEKGDWVWRLRLPEDFDLDAYRGR